VYFIWLRFFHVFTHNINTHNIHNSNLLFIGQIVSVDPGLLYLWDFIPLARIAGLSLFGRILAPKIAGILLQEDEVSAASFIDERNLASPTLPLYHRNIAPLLNS
jgi:hypothetical protein